MPEEVQRSSPSFSSTAMRKLVRMARSLISASTSFSHFFPASTRLRETLRAVFVELLRGGRQAGGVGGVALLQEDEVLEGRAVNLLGIRQHPLLGFQALIFARLKTRLFDFTALEVPQIQKPHAILLVLFQFGDASANLLPVGKPRRHLLQLAPGASLHHLPPPP